MSFFVEDISSQIEAIEPRENLYVRQYSIYLPIHETNKTIKSSHFLLTNDGSWFLSALITALYSIPLSSDASEYTPTQEATNHKKSTTIAQQKLTQIISHSPVALLALDN